MFARWLMVTLLLFVVTTAALAEDVEEEARSAELDEAAQRLNERRAVREDLEQRSEAAALKSHNVVESHCADVYASDHALAAEVSAIVSLQRSEVAALYESNPVPYLLYWRGVLAQCLGVHDKAISDLSAFVALPGALPDQVKDAEHRLRRIARSLKELNEQLEEVQESRPVNPVIPHAIVGGALLGGGALLAVFSGAQGPRIVEAECVLYGSGCEVADGLTKADYRAMGDEAQVLSGVFAVTAVGLGVGAVVQAVVGLASQGPQASNAEPAVSVGANGVVVRW